MSEKVAGTEPIIMNYKNSLGEPEGVEIKMNTNANKEETAFMVYKRFARYAAEYLFERIDYIVPVKLYPDNCDCIIFNCDRPIANIVIEIREDLVAEVSIRTSLRLTFNIERALNMIDNILAEISDKMG